MSSSAVSDVPPGRRRASAQTSRRKLLDAALEQFAARPFDEVAASDITGAAGVASGLLFHHFDSKRGIYFAALGEALTTLDAARTVDEQSPPGRRIREFLRRHLTYLAENEQLALNVILSRSGPGETSVESVEATRWERIAWASKTLGLDGQNSQMRAMWRTFGTAADDATIRWLREGRPYEVDRLVEALVELLIGALRGACALDPTLRVESAVAALRRSRPRQAEG